MYQVKPLVVLGERKASNYVMCSKRCCIDANSVTIQGLGFSFLPLSGSQSTGHRFFQSFQFLSFCSSITAQDTRCTWAATTQFKGLFIWWESQLQHLLPGLLSWQNWTRRQHLLELWVPEGNRIKVNKWGTLLKNMITIWKPAVVPSAAIKSQPKGSKGYKG